MSNSFKDGQEPYFDDSQEQETKGEFVSNNELGAPEVSATNDGAELEDIDFGFDLDSSPNDTDESNQLKSTAQTIQKRLTPKPSPSLIMVETAFLASTASLIWLINYYFPLGPLLRIFFPIPIALVYLRWGNRAASMAALVSGLLLSVLMGPTRSILFLIPYGILGVQLGALWRRGSSWLFSIGTGTIVGTLGVFFRFLLLSILLGEDLWVYLTTQMTQLLEWVFLKLGVLIQPSLFLIQAVVIAMVIVSNIVYLFVVHLVALLLLDRLGNPIPRPPQWIQVLLDYEES